MWLSRGLCLDWVRFQPKKLFPELWKYSQGLHDRKLLFKYENAFQGYSEKLFSTVSVVFGIKIRDKKRCGLYAELPSFDFILISNTPATLSRYKLIDDRLDWKCTHITRNTSALKFPQLIWNFVYLCACYFLGRICYLREYSFRENIGRKGGNRVELVNCACSILQFDFLFHIVFWLNFSTEFLILYIE